MMKVEIFGNLDEVVRELISLRRAGFDAYCDFNGHKLYSRDVTLDGAYLEVTGYTYREFLQEQKRQMEQWEREKEEAKAQSRAKTPEWIARGRKLIPEELWKEWEECIEIRISDLYNGREIEHALVVMEAHKAGQSIAEISELIDNQGHSGMSYGMLRSIISHFYPEGKQLFTELSEYERTQGLK